MDYLVYIEYNAENLQFFLWYKDYVKRFEALSEKEQALSKPWAPAENNEVPDLVKKEEKTEKKKLRRTIPGTVREDEAGYDISGAVVFSDDQEAAINPNARMSLVKDNASTFSGFTGVTVVPSSSEAYTQAGFKWQPCKQP
jgi:hypothetical protein